jgi:hypothetical protein
MTDQNKIELTIQDRLRMPFNVNRVSWRVGATNSKSNGGEASKGIALAYIDARDVMHRLDEVFGLEGWQDSYSETPSGRLICSISVMINGEWVRKSDGAGDTDVEGEKGAISDAFKRAAVKLGIGRYLYELGTTWVEVDKWKKIQNPPQLPSWATPDGYVAALTKRAEAQKLKDEK